MMKNITNINKKIMINKKNEEKEVMERIMQVVVLILI